MVDYIIFNNITFPTAYPYYMSQENKSLIDGVGDIIFPINIITNDEDDNGLILSENELTNAINYLNNILEDIINITRGNTGGQIYNIVTESAANSSVSPAGTEWALGTVNDIENLTFEPFRAATGGKPKDVVGQNMVLHLIADDTPL